MEVIHDAMAGGGVGQAQGADDREGLAAAMADHADAIDPKQQGAAMFGVVEALFDPHQIAAQKGGSHFAAPAPGQFGPQDIQKDAPDGFQEFQQHIARESITDHHVEIAGEHIPALAVASEVEAGFSG
jgi:hypothetical protein